MGEGLGGYRDRDGENDEVCRAQTCRGHSPLFSGALRHATRRFLETSSHAPPFLMFKEPTTINQLTDATRMNGSTVANVISFASTQTHPRHYAMSFTEPGRFAGEGVTCWVRIRAPYMEKKRKQMP